MVLVGLTPDGLALSLDSFDGAEHHHGPVEHTQAAFDFGGKIDVAGGIEQVDMHAAPIERDAGGVNRDATVLLFDVIVGRGGPAVDFAHPMLGPTQKQHPFGDRCFSRVNVGDDADVSNLGERAGHESLAGANM